MSSQYIVFRLDDERFAVEIEQVLEIIHAQTVFKVPNSPHYIEGLINLRGKVYPLFNLRKKFSLASLIDEKPEKSKVLIVNVGSSYIGIAVDTVDGILQIGSDSIEDTPSTISSNTKNYAKAVAKVNEKLILLLNLEAIIESSPELTVGVK